MLGQGQGSKQCVELASRLPCYACCCCWCNLTLLCHITGTKTQHQVPDPASLLQIPTSLLPFLPQILSRGRTKLFNLSATPPRQDISCSSLSRWKNKTWNFWISPLKNVVKAQQACRKKCENYKNYIIRTFIKCIQVSESKENHLVILPSRM